MSQRKKHAHASHHHKESSIEEGFISGGDIKKMNKNEKFIMALLVCGIVVFLVVSIFLLFRGVVSNKFLPSSTLTPTTKVNLTPYPTIPPIVNMTVLVNERRFNSATVTINNGNFVDFLNIGTTAMTIEGNDAASSILNIGTIQPGDDKAVTFPKPGIYTYRNKAKPTMIGTVIVK